tara:strand:+ start:486 stop:1343 length:858 start_codon:yes stop_codon:yes gene_type:complete
MNITLGNRGLCNILKSIISNFIILEKNNNKDKVFYICYDEYSILNNKAKDLPLVGRLPGKLEDIFINCKKTNSQKNGNKNWRIITFKDDNLKDKIFYMNKDKHSNEFGDIDLLYDKIPEFIKERIITNLKKMEIDRKVNKIINNYYKKLNFDENTISVQINPVRIYTKIKKTQIWDLNEFENYMRKPNSLIDLFVKEMKKYDKKYKFFVSLSYMKFLDIFIKEFGNDRIIYTPFPQNRTFCEDFIDLQLLSKNKTIIGTYLSTFCELAYYYSKCKSKVIIIGSEF